MMKNYKCQLKFWKTLASGSVNADRKFLKVLEVAIKMDFQFKVLSNEIKVTVSVKALMKSKYSIIWSEAAERNSK